MFLFSPTIIKLELWLDSTTFKQFFSQSANTIFYSFISPHIHLNKTKAKYQLQ